MRMLQSLSMATRFNMLNTALVLITALSMGLIVTYVQLARQFEARNEHSQALAMLLAETSEYAVYTKQVKELERHFARLREIPGLAYVVILDEQGQKLAQMKVDPKTTVPTSVPPPPSLWEWWSGSERRNYMEIVKPITSSGFQDEDALFLDEQAKPKVIGQVRLAMSLAYFEEIVQHSFRLGLLVVVVILIVGFGISLSMTARITSPLKSLAKTAHSMIEGRIEAIALKSGGPELRELGQAFNLMISWLTEYRAEVESYQAMLERQAYYDELTGLANRALLKDHLRMALTHCERRNSTAALMFLDLDRFKYVNDTLGHSFGDQLLQEVAQRLRHQVRSGDTVARMGGDEFVIILNDLSGDREQAKQDAGRVAEQIGLALRNPFVLHGHEINTSFSIGIALCPHDAEESESLIRNADCAMYEAKTQGRNTFRFYELSLQQRGVRRLTLETGLKRALEHNELSLYFQPKYDCRIGQLVGVEALLRWNFKDNWISPIEFIPLAEETGLILPIGEWVMETALSSLAEWRRLGLIDNNFHVGVNVAPPQFWHPNFAQRTLEILSRLMPGTHGILELELTESCLLRPTEEIQNSFVAMREAGLRFAVDDFGTGYSNLSYLKQFPLDVLKIDQSFVRDCIDDPSDATIIRAIIAMARGLGLEVIAEGVETVEHAAFLKSENCHLLQGYLLAKPMPAKDFEIFCRDISQHPIIGDGKILGAQVRASQPNISGI